MNKYINDKDIVIYEAMMVILDEMGDANDLVEKINDVEWMLQTEDYRYLYLRRLENVEDRFVQRLHDIEDGYRI